MTIKLHHNTIKKAAAHKIVLTVVEGEVVASTKDGVKLAQGLMGNKVLDDAIVKLGAPIVKARAEAKAKVAKKPAPKKAKRKYTKEEQEEYDLNGDEDDRHPQDAEIEDGDEPEEGRSMIKDKYKKVYKPFKMTNGDDLNQLLAQHLKYKDDDGKLRVNKAKLVAFAKANDCWVDDYKHLNVGQQRLNVGNRLRAKIKKNYKVVWA